MKPLFYHLHMGHPSATEYTDAGIRQAYAEAVALGQVRVHALPGPEPDLSGVTVCRLVDDDGAEVARGYAFCSARDQFCRRTGRRIAEGRAWMTIYAQTAISVGRRSSRAVVMRRRLSS